MLSSTDSVLLQLEVYLVNALLVAFNGYDYSEFDLPEGTTPFTISWGDAYSNITTADEELKDALNEAFDELEWGDVQCSDVFDIEVGDKLFQYITVHGEFAHNKVSHVTLQLKKTENELIDYLVRRGAPDHRVLA